MRYGSFESMRPARCRRFWIFVIGQRTGPVTGATGSGKSTSLSSMVDWIKRQQGMPYRKLVEDPIEFIYKNKKAVVNQREVLWRHSFFRSIAQACLKTDPDVILIGEMRDLETTSRLS